MTYHLNENFEKEWKKWKDPIFTLEDLQDALDFEDDYITLWVVKSISIDGVIEYEAQKFDSLPLETKIELLGVRFKVPNDEFSPATALIKIID